MLPSRLSSNSEKYKKFESLDGFRGSLALSVLVHQLSRSDDKQVIESGINSLCQSNSNSLSEKLARIKSKFEKHLGNNLAVQYIISGPNGGEKKINLEPSKIIFKDFISTSSSEQAVLGILYPRIDWLAHMMLLCHSSCCCWIPHQRSLRLQYSWYDGVSTSKLKGYKLGLHCWCEELVEEGLLLCKCCTKIFDKMRTRHEIIVKHHKWLLHIDHWHNWNSATGDCMYCLRRIWFCNKCDRGHQKVVYLTLPSLMWRSLLDWIHSYTEEHVTRTANCFAIISQFVKYMSLMLYTTEIPFLINTLPLLISILLQPPVAASPILMCVSGKGMAKAMVHNEILDSFLRS